MTLFLVVGNFEFILLDSQFPYQSGNSSRKVRELSYYNFGMPVPHTSCQQASEGATLVI